MAKITDITKNEEKIIVVWENVNGNYISYFEPNITSAEITAKIKIFENGFEISEDILDLIGSEF
jgi:uncharacterized protein (UPF0333 family)